MEDVEKIVVRIMTEKGKTKCICIAEGCKCKNKEFCPIDKVYRDRFEGWELTMIRNRYGR